MRPIYTNGLFATPSEHAQHAWESEYVFPRRSQPLWTSKIIAFHSPPATLQSC